MTACPLCETPLDAAPVVGTMSRGGKPSRRVACVTCGLVQVDPQPSTDEIAAYYRGDYHRDHGPVPMSIVYPDGRAEIVAPDSPRYPDAINTMHRSRARALVSDLGEQPRNVLEVGCSDGRTLDEVQRAMPGSSLCGIEPDGAKASAAHDPPRRWVRQGSLDDGAEAIITMFGLGFEKEPRHSFHVVYAFHVFEHLADPLRALATIRELLVPGGRVWLEVPDTDAPAPDLAGYHWQWVHLYDYTESTLAAMLRRAGFDEIMVYRGGSGLRAYATHGASSPRAYEPHGGPDGHAVAERLRAHEAGHAAALSNVLGRVMGGESLLAVAGVAGDADDAATLAVHAAEHQMRVEFKAYVEAVHRIAAGYRGATDMLAALAMGMDDDVTMRLEAWHPDPYVHGFAIGEGYAMQRARSLLMYCANAMHAKAASDGMVAT